MTTFTASNGIQLDENGSIEAPCIGRAPDIRAARLEWAQDALNPKLPTEPGVYVDKDGDNWYFVSDEEQYVLADGEWSEADHTPEGLREFCPFTPIEEHINEEMGK